MRIPNLRGLWVPIRHMAHSNASDMQSEYMNRELCILVDHQDRPVGSATKRVCHEQKPNQRPPLHRAFSLFLYAPARNSEEECSPVKLRLLMQQRALSKLTYPGLWSNTCCSHPLCSVPGEEEQHDALGLRRAAQRKVLHELGIKPERYLSLDSIHFLSRILYYAPNSSCADPRWAEHEVDGLLVSVLPQCPEDYPGSPMIALNPDEVSATHWLSRSEADSLLHPDKAFASSCPWITEDSLTPWFRALLTTGLLHRLWDWAEAYACRQRDPIPFSRENARWKRDKIHQLHCA